MSSPPSHRHHDGEHSSSSPNRSSSQAEPGKPRAEKAAFRSHTRPASISNPRGPQHGSPGQVQQPHATSLPSHDARYRSASDARYPPSPETRALPSGARHAGGAGAVGETSPRDGDDKHHERERHRHAQNHPTFAAPSSFLFPAGGGGAAISSVAAQQRAPEQQHGHDRMDSQGSAGGRHRSSLGMNGALDREQMEGLKAIRAFLRVRTSYDILPLSFRLIVFDTALLVRKSLNILLQNGIVSAPLWDSKTSTFAGLLTTSDYINVVQYYWQNPDALGKIDQFRLNSLPDVERAIGTQPVETISIHPDRPIYEACRKMLVSRARRIPLVDFDDETQRAMVVSVVTQYRILKFVAVNVKETQKLCKPLKDIGVGTYGEPGRELAVAAMDTPVMDVIHMLVKKSISSVPILDKDGTVLNVFEGVDVITLIKGGAYDDLGLTVGEALLKRDADFAGIYTCTVDDRLDAIFDTIRKSRVHRMVVIDERSRLKGVLTLSDILEYVLLEGEDEGVGVGVAA